MQGSLARAETQVIRYKTTAEAAEKAEGELKVERRKLQREVIFQSISFSFEFIFIFLFPFHIFFRIVRY